MNALAPYAFTQKDPTGISWSPTLPIELALKTATPEELRVEYGYSRREWDALPRNAVFLRDLAAACELVRQEGMSFKLKAKLIAEENLKATWKMIHDNSDKAPPPAVKTRLIELCAIWAGFDERRGSGAGGSGSGGPVNANTLQIQINLGKDF